VRFVIVFGPVERGVPPFKPASWQIGGKLIANRPFVFKQGFLS